MAKTIYKKYPAIIQWARLNEDNRDMGPGDDSSVGQKITAQDGVYKLDMIVTDEVKEQMIKDGISPAPLGHQQFHETEDGKWRYTAKRGHLNPNIIDDDGEPLVQGPPQVLDYNESEKQDKAVLYNGLIGNDSEGIVKLAIYKGRSNIVTLNSVALTKIVEYVPEEKWF